MSRLELTFRQRGGQTYLAEQFVDNPLKVVRPFPLDGGRVLLQILNVGPGLMAEDNFALTINVQAGAKVVLVNQSATKLHSMPSGSARQHLTISVGEGAECEYYPGLVIPYRDADFAQRTEVELAARARFGTLERWSMGRVAFGENFTFRKLSSRLTVRREGLPIYTDGLELTPLLAPKIGISDACHYLVSGVWLWEDENQPPDSTRTVIRPVFGDTAISQGAFCAGRYLRGMGSDVLALSNGVGQELKNWRAQSGLAPLDLERFGQIV